MLFKNKKKYKQYKDCKLNILEINIYIPVVYTTLSSAAQVVLLIIYLCPYNFIKKLLVLSLYINFMITLKIIIPILHTYFS